jgi:hypothetical protein
MNRAMRPVVIGLATVTFLGATAAGAYAAVGSAATTTCTAIDAPTAMNDLPASADCGTPGGRTGLARTAAAVVSTTPLSTTPLPFDHTNGDILVITKIDGTNDIAFGGNFSLVYTPDGVSHSTNDFAVVDETTGAIVYTGNPRNGSSSDRYVRSITSLNGVIYAGGDFTSWDGSSRTHAVRLTPTGNPAPAAFAVASWNPAPGSGIRGMAVDSNAVYLGVGGSSVRAVNPTTGSTIWTKSVSGGEIHAVFEDQGYIFVGGLFETYNGVTQHGLVKIQPSDGSLVTAFNAHLRADTNSGADGSFDGEEILAMAAPPDPSQLLVGCGGHAPTAGTLSNETIMLNFTTGARDWTHTNFGDGQAVAAVGDTSVSGYHNNSSTAGNTSTPNYFSVQLEDTNGAVTTWDPGLYGNQSNADGGNSGVQAMYADPSAKTLFLAGAFTHRNGTSGTTYQSLIAYSFGSGTPPTVPGAPTNVTATAGDTTATVSWTAPVSNGGSPITSYTVVASPDDGTVTFTGATAASVTGLTDGQQYTFTVVANNAQGPSAPSTPSNQVTPTAPTVPDPPTNVTATAGDTTASVSWTAPVSNGGSPITGYTVVASPDDGAVTFTGATAASVTGLTDGQQYTFTVVANNAQGPSNPSTPSNPVTPTAPTVPDPPTNVTATAGDTTAAVSWTAPVSNGGSPITSYTVVASPDDGTVTFTGATAASVTGLTDGQQYTFTVVANNAQGPSNPSTPSNPVTPSVPVTPPGMSNTAEGGAAGAAVTVANSGGASGNPFTFVDKGSGASIVYATAAAAHGTLGYAVHGSSGTSTFMGWNGFSATSMAIRFYFNPGPTLPSKVIRIADIRNSTATAARVEYSASNQLFIQNTAGKTLTTFPHALQANTWYRIELTISVSSSSATINAAYYPADSTTPVDPPYSTNTGNTGTANITQVSFGSPASATWTGTSYFDDLAADPGSTAFIGPS